MESSQKASTRPYNLPPHGTRQRYRSVGCKCVACTRGPHGIDIPDVLTWPYRFLARAAGEMAANFDPEKVEHWKMNGMGDYEADEACISIGLMPHEVFPGYDVAGLDCEVYP